MFKENKYTNWYFSIIEKSKKLKRSKNESVYYERHHIIPKSLGGTDLVDNLVLLTAKEHFVCHLLLTKMTTGRNLIKMKRVLVLFSDNYSKNSRMYEISCRYMSESMTGENNPMYKKIPWNKGKKNHMSKEKYKNVLNAAKKWREDGGMDGEYRKKISDSLKGVPKPVGFGAKISNAIKGENHWSFSGYYHTPLGVFPNSTSIEDVIPNQLVRRWCKNSNKIISKHSYSQSSYLKSLGSSVIGKTYKDIGFYYSH